MSAQATNPDDWARRPARFPPCGVKRAVPIRSCSRRGLPCLQCYQCSGALLPHLFTLTPQAGRYILCGAIPQTARHRAIRPGVTRRRVSMEPGLSSVSFRPTRPSDRLAGVMCVVGAGRSRFWERIPVDDALPGWNGGGQGDKTPPSNSGSWRCVQDFAVDHCH